MRLFAATVNATGPNDYLLSIAKNCAPGGGGTIIAGPGSFQFASAVFTELEGRTATITVSRTDGTTGTASVNYTTSNGSAIGGTSCGPGIDFIQTSGTLNFAEGDALESFTVQLCSDASVEGDQTIGLTLSAPTGGATLGSPNPATLNVLDVATQFCNTTSIVIPATGTSPVAAAPYPSIITASGLSGTITGVRVTLYNAPHGNPDDVDILLVGPGGQNIIMMSDSGGGAGLDAPATITFSDAAATQLPDTSTIATRLVSPDQSLDRDRHLRRWRTTRSLRKPRARRTSARHRHARLRSSMARTRTATGSSSSATTPRLQTAARSRAGASRSRRQPVRHCN